MADVTGLYRRFGVKLPDLRDGWASTRCFTGTHADRHPSARVHLRSGGFRCFTCGVRGGVLDALELLGVRDRRDAVRLATEYGILDAPQRPGRRPRPAVPFTAPPRPDPVVAQPTRHVDWAAPRPAVVGERIWTYVDEHGSPVGRIRRQDIAGGGKQIWQERPDGDQWLPGLQGVKLPLYQLPLVRAHARQGGHVLIVEGEKAVDALTRIGLLATTNAGGAGKWRPAHTRQLIGAAITVICDSDLPGRLHAIDVTENACAAGLTATMPLDPYPLRNDGSDIVDYLADSADTIRAVSPVIIDSEIRSSLRRQLERELGRLLPADTRALQLRAERAHHLHSPNDKQLLSCDVCGHERPHVVTHGIAYCPCGASHSFQLRQPLARA